MLCLMSEATLPRIMMLLRLLESTIGGQDGNRMPLMLLEKLPI